MARNKDLGLFELIAIALGGMVGGGIFSILGVSVEQIGNATPIAILVGGTLAFFAAFSYVKLALYYKDEGATYSFFKLTFPKYHFASAAIGWLITFGYISTLALYAFTFSSYFCSQFPVLNHPAWHKVVAGGVITLFAIVNLLSVKGMGKIEDWMVYTKLLILLFISVLLAAHGKVQNATPVFEPDTTFMAVLVVASLTFVAYEGFQLVINAYNEMREPQKNIPKAVYTSIAIAIFLYVTIAFSALETIPKQQLIQGKEYALASGAQQFLGNTGLVLVIFGALLATSSAISGTLFGASRLMAVIATDGYFPKSLAHRIKVHIPDKAIILMGILSFVLILSGGLQLILEFGSITFILVSFLMAYSNYRVRKKTKTPAWIALVAMVFLFAAGFTILLFEFQHNKMQLLYILGIYAILVAGSYYFARKRAADTF
ncbi:amino acid permease [bacterium]|nr:amino acid permease [bacterium]